MKNEEMIQVPKAFLRSDAAKPFAKEFVIALNQYNATDANESELDLLINIAGKRKKLKKPAERIAAALTGEGIELTPEEIVTKVNATLRGEGVKERLILPEVNGFMSLLGIRSEKKPKGIYQKVNGRISFIEQSAKEEGSEEMPQEALAGAGASKKSNRK